MGPNEAKTFGGVGSILAVVGFDIVGYILVLIGLRGLGKYYNDEGIRRNSLWWFILGIIGAIAAIAVFVVALSWIFSALTFAGPIAGPFVAFAGLFTSMIVALVIAEIFFVISAIYLKRAYAALAAKSGEGLFNIAAKLYLWGAVLTIVLVGLLLIWISWIVSAVAFFAMTPQRPEVAAQAAPLQSS